MSIVFLLCSMLFFTKMVVVIFFLLFLSIIFLFLACCARSLLIIYLISDYTTIRERYHNDGSDSTSTFCVFECTIMYHYIYVTRLLCPVEIKTLSGIYNCSTTEAYWVRPPSYLHNKLIFIDAAENSRNVRIQN